MSNSLAIAAVTATLRNLLNTNLTADLPGTSTTTMPIDKARTGTSNQVNLFLYQTMVDPSWRNMDVPHQVRSGETSPPPLPLTLFYLVTAYGENDDDTLSHRLLARSMGVLHDHPVLSRDEIKAALPDNDLHKQTERVRITPVPLSLEEMSKLWTTFQTQYRISAAYRISIVLIESAHSARTPLPVLTRGPADDGILASTDLIPPFPALGAVRPPNEQPSARLNDNLTLSGHHLDGDNVTVRFVHPSLPDPIDLAAAAGGTATELTVQVPNVPADWPAGFYTVSAVVSRAGEQDRTTNERPLSLAPSITSPMPMNAARGPGGNVTLNLTCTPQVWPEQRAALLLGDREIPAQPHPAKTASLSFVISAAPAGEHFVRLRVNGVDSLLVDRSVTPPVFDPTQKVTIT